MKPFFKSFEKDGQYILAYIISSDEGPKMIVQLRDINSEFGFMTAHSVFSHPSQAEEALENFDQEQAFEILDNGEDIIKKAMLEQELRDLKSFGDILKDMLEQLMDDRKDQSSDDLFKPIGLN